MSLPTAKQLIEQLRTALSENGQRLTDEQLAARLPITLSTFNRWKKADTDRYTAVIEMVAMAGWLDEGRLARDLPAVDAVLAEEERVRRLREADRKRRLGRKRQSAQPKQA